MKPRQITLQKKKYIASNSAEHLKVEFNKTSLKEFLSSRENYQKRKILLIIPNIIGDKIAATAPLPGVAYVAGFVRHTGHDVNVVDMRIDNNRNILYQKIKEYQPDFIGLSFMTQHEFEKIYKFTSEIHNRFPNIKIIIGGAGASALYNKVLHEAFVDYAVTREGEYTIIELMDGLKPLDQISGLVWKKNNTIVKNDSRKFEYHIDELPFPAYDLFPMNKYVDKKIPIVTSRGCPYRCTFCANKASMGVAWRPRSPENVVEEIKFWYQKGFNTFHFVDDNFTLDMKRAEKICDLIVASGMKIKWDLRNGIRVDRIDKNLLTKMKQAGCFYFALGIESIDQEVLDKMKKDLKVEDIMKGVEACEEVGIPFGGFFIVGLLKDTYEKFLKCYEFAKKHNFSEVRFYNPMPFPGTELYEELVEKDLLLVDPDEYLNNNSKFKNEPVFETPEFTYKERKKALALGQDLVMEKFLEKEFGKIAGSIAHRLWRIEKLRNTVQPIGIFAWKTLRKLKRKKASSSFQPF